MGKPEGEVRYNFRRADRNPTCMEWFFLVVYGDKRTLEAITRRIYQLLIPIVEEGPTYEGTVKGSSLKYKLINFDSGTRTEESDIRKISDKTRRDRTLYTRAEKDGLGDYLDEHFG